MEAYHSSTEPILDYYRGRGLVETVNTTQAIETVSEKVQEAIHPLVASQAGWKERND